MADFVGYAIDAVAPHVDKIIILEGAWGTSVKANNLFTPRSTDGTIEILKEKQKQHGNIEIHHLSLPTQLQQRSEYFHIVKDYPHYMWLIDADEIYDEIDIIKVKDAIIRHDPKESQVLYCTSLTFVNDFYHYRPIDWARIFYIEHPDHEFIAPNHIFDKRKNRPLVENKKPIANFFHYSYVISPERFKQKVADRIEVHGEFKWELQDGVIRRAGINYYHKTNYVPPIIRNHPKAKIKLPDEIFNYKARTKIGFLIHSGIGNMILATPMLKALRKLYPDARISVFTWERCADIIRGLDFIDDIITHRYEAFVDSVGGLDYLLISPTAVIPTARARLIERSKSVIELPPHNWGKHESEYNMDLVRMLGYKGETPRPSCVWDELTVTYENAAIISISHLAEGHWWLKSIEDDREWLRVVDFLTSCGYNVIALGTNIGTSILDQHPKVINLCGKTTITEAAAIIKNAKLFVGLDGALAHIAACFEIPSVVVFTFTNIIKNLPLNRNLLVVAKNCPKRTTCQHGNWAKCESRFCRRISAKDIVSKIRELRNIDAVINWNSSE